VLGPTEVVDEELEEEIVVFSAVRGVVEAVELLSVVARTEFIFSNGELRNRVANSQNTRAAVDKSSAIFFTDVKKAWFLASRPNYPPSLFLRSPGSGYLLNSPPDLCIIKSAFSKIMSAFSKIMSAFSKIKSAFSKIMSAFSKIMSAFSKISTLNFGGNGTP
jgi:hypothetical protein